MQILSCNIENLLGILDHFDGNFSNFGTLAASHVTVSHSENSTTLATLRLNSNSFVPSIACIPPKFSSLPLTCLRLAPLMNSRSTFTPYGLYQFRQAGLHVSRATDSRLLKSLCNYNVLKNVATL